MIPAGSNVKILAEVQEHIFCLIKVDRLIILHMFQVHFLKSSAEIYYNIVCNAGMGLAHCGMINIEFLSKYPDVVP